MNQIDPQDYITVSQFAVKLGLSRATIYRWVVEGKIKMVIRIGSRFFIHKDEIQNIVRDYNE